MTEIKMSVTDIIVIILAVSGLNWFIITLALVPVKNVISDLRKINSVVFRELKEKLTKEECKQNMENCRKIREAQNGNHL